MFDPMLVVGKMSIVDIRVSICQDTSARYYHYQDISGVHMQEMNAGYWSQWDSGCLSQLTET